MFVLLEAGRSRLCCLFLSFFPERSHLIGTSHRIQDNLILLICVFFFVFFFDVTDESKAVGPRRRDMLGDTERRVGVLCLLRPSKSRPAISRRKGGTDEPAGSSAPLRHVSALSPEDCAQLNPSPCADFLRERSNETRAVRSVIFTAQGF